MAFIFTLNVNTFRVSPTIETLPIIKASLVYATYNQGGGKGLSPSRSDKETEISQPKERMMVAPPVETPSPTEKTVKQLSASNPQYRAIFRPAYPMIARLRGQEGVVKVSAEVLTDGTVGIVRINNTSGYAALDGAALEAVKTWLFESAKRTGKSIAAWVVVPVRFLLADNE